MTAWQKYVISEGMQNLEDFTSALQALNALLLEGFDTFGPEKTSQILVQIAGRAGIEVLRELTQTVLDEHNRRFGNRGLEDKPWTKFLLDRRYLLFLFLHRLLDFIVRFGNQLVPRNGYLSQLLPVVRYSGGKIRRAIQTGTHVSLAKSCYESRDGRRRSCCHR